MTDVTKLCARLGVVALVALGTTACSSVPDWVDPTTWVGGGDDSHTALPSMCNASNWTVTVRPTPLPRSTASMRSEIGRAHV